MKTLALILLFSLANLWAADPTSRAQANPITQIKEMRRGVNVLGYDPFWRDESKARFKAEHFQRIREGGFQTVRVNLHAFRHMDAENRLSEEWFRKTDWIITNALAANLFVILDEHDFQAVGKDPEATRPKLMAFWKQVSERYQNQPSRVLFEILNEPNSKLTSESWNDWIREALGIIRKTNPTRNVIIGPASWNNIHALKDLELPADDRHLIVTVHYYIPMEFTHQGAPWTESTAHLYGITWGTDQEKRRVEEDFKRVQDWAKKENRPILLGEFGAYDKGDMQSRVRYTSHVARTAEAMGWAWTYWQFDSDFVVFDMAKNDWNTPIWKALIP